MRAEQTSHRVIVAILLGLIAYGSLYPLGISLEIANSDAWIRFFTTWGGQDSLGDVVGNIVLFMPLGFFVATGFAAQDRRALRFGLTLVWGLLFALVLQSLQVLIPARDAAMIDVVWNALGLGVGLVLGSATVARRWLVPSGQPIPMVSLVIAALWGATELVPLVPAIDPQLVKDSLKPLLLEPRFSLLDSLAAAVGIGVLGHALSRITDERASLAWLLLVAVLVVAAKPFIVVVELDLSTVIGFGLGCAAWAVLLRLAARQRALVLLVGLVLVLTASSLEPFQLAHRSNPMGWVPFAEVLEGSMLINSRSLATSLFTFTAILWLVQLRGGSMVAASLLLALWVGVLEFAQIFLVGRTPSITEPLWVLLVAATLAYLADTPRPVESGTTRPSTPSESGPWRRVLIQFAVTAAIGAIPLWVLVRWPGVPYNLRELLLGDSHPLAAWVFVLALLWVGAGAAWMGRQIRRARWPILRIPMTAFAAAMVSLLLLNLSITQESILDVAGSNNLYWFVTNRDIWGEYARALFLATDSNLVAFVERPVRYAALYGPVVITLAIAQMAWLEYREHRDPGRVVAARVAWITLNALPWLVLCKAIAFDWSSTDNLNELITRQGPLGINGDYYIYGVIAVVAVNAVFVAHVRSVRTAFVALFVSILCLPLTWWLLNQGLEAQVQKYGLTFSGVQFLLGPDRSELLSDEVLLARWIAVQIGAVSIFALGLRIATPVFGHTAGSGNRAVACANEARPGRRRPTGIPVRLTEQQVDFLDELAESEELDFEVALQRILDSVLGAQTEPALTEWFSHPEYRAGERHQRLRALPIAPRKDQSQRLTALAEQGGVSPSRAVRHAVQLFMDQRGHHA